MLDLPVHEQGQVALSALLEPGLAVAALWIGLRRRWTASPYRRALVLLLASVLKEITHDLSTP